MYRYDDFDTTLVERRVTQAEGLLRRVAARHVPAVFASSFGAEDMVLIDMIARQALRIRLLTIDTGRLPEETHALIERTREHYRLPIDIFTPDARLLQDFVRENGVNAFYRSTELRKGCCAVRKTEPLKRALVGQRRVDHRPAPCPGGHSPERSAGGIRRGARTPQVQSARRVGRRRRLELPARPSRPLQRVARSWVPEHRLRAVHARRRNRARMSAPVAGGGKRPSTRSADCMYVPS